MSVDRVAVNQGSTAHGQPLPFVRPHTFLDPGIHTSGRDLTFTLGSAQPVQVDRDSCFALPSHRCLASLFSYNDLGQFTHLLGEQLNQIVERDDPN